MADNLESENQSGQQTSGRPPRAIDDPILEALIPDFEGFGFVDESKVEPSVAQTVKPAPDTDAKPTTTASHELQKPRLPWFLRSPEDFKEFSDSRWAMAWEIFRRCPKMHTQYILPCIRRVQAARANVETVEWKDLPEPCRQAFRQDTRVILGKIGFRPAVWADPRGYVDVDGKKPTCGGVSFDARFPTKEILAALDEEYRDPAPIATFSGDDGTSLWVSAPTPAEASKPSRRAETRLEDVDFVWDAGMAGRSPHYRKAGKFPHSHEAGMVYLEFPGELGGVESCGSGGLTHDGVARRVGYLRRFLEDGPKEFLDFRTGLRAANPAGPRKKPITPEGTALAIAALDAEGKGLSITSLARDLIKAGIPSFLGIDTSVTGSGIPSAAQRQRAVKNLSRAIRHHRQALLNLLRSSGLTSPDDGYFDGLMGGGK